MRFTPVDMSRVANSPNQAPTLRPEALRLGERLRQLRTAAGLTQTELAGSRFSKEYISQIERGKTRPTRETTQWLADRLGVDQDFLTSGVSVEERGRVEAALVRAEALNQAREYSDALTAFSDCRNRVVATGASDLQLRHFTGEAWAKLQEGHVREGIDLLSKARGIAEDSSFTDLDRADVLFRLGVGRYMLSSVQSAVNLLNEAFALAERSRLPCDLLKADILGWRSRCWRRQRDFEAAKEDVHLALELAEGLNDPRRIADVYFYASIVAERDGRWVLARSYAERAKAQYEEISDRANLGRLLNNLGGLNFLLGKPSEALNYLKRAFSVALDTGSEVDAGQAVSSLAQVHLRTGDVDAAEHQARHALQLLAGRADFLDEIGNAQLVLGRALLAQGRLEEAAEMFSLAETSFDQLSSASHRAAAWVAQGDLAARRGDDRAAARLYRNAAEALQDVRF